MVSEIICDCGMIFDDEAGVKWHKTTEAHLWHKLKKEKKIPEGARCDICGIAAHLKRVKGKWAPKWYVVDNKEKPTVRCRKCKRERLYLIKIRFRELFRRRAVEK